MVTSTRTSRWVAGALGLAIALAPVVATVGSPAGSQPRVLAGCNESIDTTDSFSMDCAPTMVPDMSDQLTEAEVAEPGWNAHPGGGGGAGGGPR